MQNVEPGELNASRPDFFELRLILSPPSVRKREPVQRIATWPKMRLSFPRNTRSPVNQCPEHVKKQGLTPYWALPHCLCATAAVPTLGSAQVTRVSRFRDRNGASAGQTR
jgi:hypothetical protein